MKFRKINAFELIVLMVGVTMLSGMVYADDDDDDSDSDKKTNVQIVRGQVVTGANRLLGEPLFTYDFAANTTFGFNTLDEHNPGAELPIPLTPDSHRNTVLATTFPNLAGVPAGVLPNVNIALRDVGTYINGLLDRGLVPFHLDPGAPVIGPTQAEPHNPDPIRLRDWTRGRGLAITRCGHDGNYASVFVKRLIPNRLYSAWALWLSEAPGTAFQPIALGGAPSVIMTDAHGKGSLTRELNFCPEDAARDGVGAERLIGFIVILHSDHVSLGPIPTPSPLGFPPGSIVHGHMWFDFGAGQPIAE